MGGGRCQYSNVPDMFNLCKYAHSVEELDEWKERFEWRQMKRSIAKEQNMFSYMDTLLEEYEKADYRVAVVSIVITIGLFSLNTWWSWPSHCFDNFFCCQVL